ncbi:MAG TPA: hypothetical protein PKX15_06670 [Bacteroidales bacterium]|nr:hypothetical protein [Bacteroidales bacterium]
MKSKKRSIAWKVVKLSENNQYLSACIILPSTYSFNKWTYPDVERGYFSFLYVFKTRQQAINFRRGLEKIHPSNRYRVFKCKVKNAEEHKDVITYNGFQSISSKYPYAPEGTLFADAVKLIK